MVWEWASAWVMGPAWVQGLAKVLEWVSVQVQGPEQELAWAQAQAPDR
jgi:hypothetical protein